jgi:hypothetical protein
VNESELCNNQNARKGMAVRLYKREFTGFAGEAPKYFWARM